jgi:hypothetical protein
LLLALAALAHFELHVVSVDPAQPRTQFRRLRHPGVESQLDDCDAHFDDPQEKQAVKSMPASGPPLLPPEGAEPPSPPHPTMHTTVSRHARAARSIYPTIAGYFPAIQK